MLDPAPLDPPALPPPDQAWLKCGEILLQGVALLTAAASLAWLLDSLVRQRPAPGDWVPQALVCAAAVLTVAGGMLRHYRCWTLPTRRLSRILPARSRRRNAD